MFGNHFDGFVDLTAIGEVENILILYKTDGNTYEENVSLRILYQKMSVSLANFTRLAHAESCNCLTRSANWT